MREHYKNPMIAKAFNVLESLSADEKARELAERREKALKDEAMFINEATRKGKREQAEQTASILLTMGDLTFEKIAKATGLTIDEIKKLDRKAEANA